MTDRYKILDGEGRIVNIIKSDEAYALSIGATLASDGDEIYSEPLVPVQKTVFTKLEFMNKFSPSELEAIYTAAKAVISIEVWLDKFKLAESVDISNPDTIAGIQALEAGGLLAEGRAVEILG